MAAIGSPRSVIKGEEPKPQVGKKTNTSRRTRKLKIGNTKSNYPIKSETMSMKLPSFLQERI
jgi:hypothetical protein